MLPWVLAWLALTPLAVLRAEVLAESDTFWETRAGLGILEHGRIPTVDGYSWTVAGHPWTLNSWGFDVLDGLAYRAAGLSGVAMLGAGLLLVLLALLLAAARRLGAAPHVAAAVILLAAPLLVGWLSARPQLADYIAILLVVRLLEGVRTPRGQARRMLGLALVTVIWVNLHAGALLGLAVEALLLVLLLHARAGAGAAARVGVAAAVCVLASLLNPYGIGLLAQVGGVQSASSGLITEWQGADPADPVQLALLLLAFGGLVVAARRHDLVWMAAIGAALAGSAVALRFLPIAALLALPPLAAGASRPLLLRYLAARRVVLIPGAAVFLGTLVVLAATGLGRVGAPAATYPTALIQQIPPGAHVVNAYDYGGLVILDRPDVRVFIDSRNDLYGPARVRAALRTLQGRGDVQVTLRGADAVLVPRSSGLARRLAADRSWTVRGRDGSAILFTRDLGEQR